MFEDIEDDDLMDEMLDENDDEAPPEESENRNFVVIVGILIAIVLLLLLCTVVFLGLRRAQTNGGARETANAESTAAIIQQTEVQLAVEGTEQAASFTATPTRTEPATDVPEPTATNTPVVAQPTDTPDGSGPTEDPRTATVSALLTEAARPTDGTLVPTSTGFPTELPDTGFADDVGVGGLLLLASLAVILIFLVRRLRFANR
jgi:cytoskeletal protein RodZ